MFAMKRSNALAVVGNISRRLRWRAMVRLSASELVQFLTTRFRDGRKNAVNALINAGGCASRSELISTNNDSMRTVDTIALVKTYLLSGGFG
jgi:hypothetical protein